MRPALSALILLLALSSACSPSVRPSKEIIFRSPTIPLGPPAPTPPQAFALSGGVSLGAYEAGATWALLELRRQARTSGSVDHALGASAGASAGGINTLLAAIESCSPTGASTSTSNLLRNTWMSIGVDTMLPRDPEAYLEEDGLLTRTAFDEVSSNIVEAASSGDLIPGCQVPITLMITAVDPVMIGNESLQVPSVRVAVPLLMRVDDHGVAHFENDLEAAPRQDLMGATLLLAETESAEGLWEVAAQDVLKATLSSAAFPLAFSPLTLEHCVLEEECGEANRVAGAGCMHLSKATGRTLAPCASQYIDGGVFDNIPLGAAVAQLEAERQVEKPFWSTAEDATYFFLDPELRRMETPPMVSLGAERGLGVWLESAFWIGFTGRKRELESLLRTLDFGDHGGASLLDRFLADDERSLLVSSRLPRLAADQLGKFGAFLDRRLRSFDYYAGIYDTLSTLAFAEDRGELYDSKLMAAFRALSLNKDPLATYVFLRLLQVEEAAATLELDWARPAPSLQKLLNESFPGLERSNCDGLEDRELQGICFVCNALVGVDPLEAAMQQGERASFSDFASALRESGMKAHPGTAMYAMLGQEIWWTDLAERAIHRLMVIEAQEESLAQDDGDTRRESRARAIRKWLLGTGLMMVKTMRKGDDLHPIGHGAEWDPSTIPDERAHIAHALPYVASVDGLRGGLELAWEPTFRAGGVFEWRAFLSTRATPSWLSAGIGTGPMLMIPSLWPGLSHFGLYAYAEQVLVDWGDPHVDEKATNLSAILSLELATKLRIAFELELARYDGEWGTGHYGWTANPESLSIWFGLVDFNGILYWLAN